MGKIQLPPNWKLMQLGDLGEIYGGGTPSTKILKYWDGDIRWLVPSEVTKHRGIYISDTERHITPEGLQKCASKLFPSGTVLMTSRATIGEVVINTLPMATNQGFINICCDQNKTFNEFLTYWIIQNKQIFKDRANGVTFKEISRSNFKTIPIYLPPLPEQKTIAHTLRTIQKAKETRLRELELERERKAALMQYLFTFGTSSSHNKVELQETKIGYIPKFWQINQCDHVCEKISVGVVVKPASHYVEKGVPAFRSLNIREDRLSTHNLVFFSEEANDTILIKSKLKTGDVLIVRTGYPGTSCVVPPEFEGANCIDIVFARPKREVVTSEYLSRYFNSPEGKRQALTAKTGLAQQHLNVNAVQRCLIPIPPLHEQKQITDVLIACDRKIQALEKEIALTDELFHAMLEQLMTGKISTQPLTETYV